MQDASATYLHGGDVLAKCKQLPGADHLALAEQKLLAPTAAANQALQLHAMMPSIINQALPCTQ